MSPKRVILTDLPEVVPLLQHNIGLNQFLQVDENIKSFLSSQVQAYEYSWGESFIISESDARKLELLDSFKESNLLIASDVIYYPEGYRPLIDSLEWWLSLPPASVSRIRRCILAHRHRHPEDGKFFEMIEQSSVINMKEIKRDLESQNSLKDVRLFEIVKK